MIFNKCNLSKTIILLLLLVALIVLCFFCCSDSINEKEEYFYKINSLIKDIDFNTAEVEKNKIILYNSKREQVKEIPFADYNSKINVYSIRKEKNKICFIIGGSVDDEVGIVFINDKADDILDGIKKIKRIGGNSYLYET